MGIQTVLYMGDIAYLLPPYSTLYFIIQSQTTQQQPSARKVLINKRLSTQNLSASNDGWLSAKKSNEEVQACKEIAKAALKARTNETFCIGKSPKVVGKELVQQERERLRCVGKDTSTKKRNKIGKRGRTMQKLRAFDATLPDNSASKSSGLRESSAASKKVCII